MTRREIARELEVGESWLRSLEDRGLLPAWGTVSEERYRAIAATVRGARSAGVSVGRIRQALLGEGVSA